MTVANFVTVKSRKIGKNGDGAFWESANHPIFLIPWLQCAEEEKKWIKLYTDANFLSTLIAKYVLNYGFLYRTICNWGLKSSTEIATHCDFSIYRIKMSQWQSRTRHWHHHFGLVNLFLSLDLSAIITFFLCIFVWQGLQWAFVTRSDCKLLICMRQEIRSITDPCGTFSLEYILEYRTPTRDKD